MRQRTLDSRRKVRLFAGVPAPDLKWFRRWAKTEPAIHDKEDRNSKFPADIWNNKRQLTLETEYIIRDIGMYLGETFRKMFREFTGRSIQSPIETSPPIILY